jgi:hypothetical protein
LGIQTTAKVPYNEAMTDVVATSQGKSAGQITREAVWFFLHAIIAVVILFAVVFAMYLAHPDPDASGPKLLGTALGFFVPMVAGFFITRSRQDATATYTWISGLLVFAIVCVWVLDLPTGVGLCEKCGATEKLYRTFFDINHGSGLMAGDGLLVGTWIPLSMIGYAIGSRFALKQQ